MKKEIVIDGMSCGHCSGRVIDALNKLDGVSAQVDLQSKTATVTLQKDVSDEVLVKAITDVGYTVLSVQ